jgi:hypothetical protein
MFATALYYGFWILDPIFSILDPGSRVDKILDPQIWIHIKELKYF